MRLVSQITTETNHSAPESVLFSGPKSLAAKQRSSAGSHGFSGSVQITALLSRWCVQTSRPPGESSHFMLTTLDVFKQLWAVLTVLITPQKRIPLSNSVDLRKIHASTVLVVYNLSKKPNQPNQGSMHITSSWNACHREEYERDTRPRVHYETAPKELLHPERDLTWKSIHTLWALTDKLHGFQGEFRLQPRSGSAKCRQPHTRKNTSRY